MRAHRVVKQIREVGQRPFFKDEVLNRLAENYNIAQFVSFGPSRSLPQRYSRIFGYEPNHCFANAEEAVTSLLAAAPDGTVNVRSFKPDDAQSHPFLYGLGRLSIVLEKLQELSARGYYTIVNETVDVNDGGVSGVVEGRVVEFAPGVVPRFVERDNVDPIPALPVHLGLLLLETVYGIRPELRFPDNCRVEFSLHPKARGWRRTHTIIWELQEVNTPPIRAYMAWPNAFSRKIGDKAFGLLIASLFGLPVPRCTVLPRHLPPSWFTFGEPTGATQVWIRTCPREQDPGKYTTARGWRDPYKLMELEDPEDKHLVSCLVQDEVNAQFAGALITQANGSVIVEGVHGFGDAFMQGQAAPADIPESIREDVIALQKQAAEQLGPVRIEWVHDGQKAWVVQLHAGVSVSAGRLIVPGHPKRWRTFRVDEGLEALRKLIKIVQESGEGLELLGNIGITSHIADVLRRANIPSKIRV
jgi:hypothetical protein